MKSKGIPRIVQPHGGALLAHGVPGHRGGGGAPLKHGLYADLTKHPELRELLIECKAAAQPLDTLEEVAMIRALAVHLFNRVKAGRRLSAGQVMAAVKILAEVSKAVKRIEDINAANAISRKNFIRVMREMGSIVNSAIDNHLPDLEARDAMKLEVNQRWKAIPLS